MFESLPNLRAEVFSTKSLFLPTSSWNILLVSGCHQQSTFVIHMLSLSSPQAPQAAQAVKKKGGGSDFTAV
jgi:hypothetical protein